MKVNGPLKLVIKTSAITFWRHDIQHNDIQHNDFQHNDIQHNDIQHYDIQHNDTKHRDIDRYINKMRHSP